MNMKVTLLDSRRKSWKGLKTIEKHLRPCRVLVAPQSNLYEVEVFYEGGVIRAFGHSAKKACKHIAKRLKSGLPV